MNKNYFLLPIFAILLSSCSLIGGNNTSITEPKTVPSSPLTEQQKANQENLDKDLNTLYTKIFE